MYILEHTFVDKYILYSESKLLPMCSHQVTVQVWAQAHIFQRLRTFFTASLYCAMVASFSPSFFSRVTESLYSCTSFLPSSSSRSPFSSLTSLPSTSRMFCWDGLSSQLYSSISARVFSASQVSVFYRRLRKRRREAENQTINPQKNVGKSSRKESQQWFGMKQSFSRKKGERKKMWARMSRRSLLSFSLLLLSQR